MARHLVCEACMYHSLHVSTPHQDPHRTLLYVGSSRIILAYHDSSWILMAYLGSSLLVLVILAHLGLCLITSDHLGSLRIIVDHHGSSRIMSDHHGSSWITMDHLESSRDLLQLCCTIGSSANVRFVTNGSAVLLKATHDYLPFVETHRFIGYRPERA